MRKHLKHSTHTLRDLIVMQVLFLFGLTVLFLIKYL